MGTVRWMTVAALGMATALLLVGCSTPSTWPTTVTLADSTALSAAEDDAVWALVGGTGPRPFVEAAAPREPFDAMAAFGRCMNAAGYSNDYVVTDNGMTLNEPNSVATAQEGVDWYRCFAANPQDHRTEFLGSIARRAYLYDYFQNSLVPCLALAGYPVPDAPTREAYLSGEVGASAIPYLSYPWNPYDAVVNTILLSETNRIKKECPEYPPGVTPPGFVLG
jgi:hypothetical protein